MAFTPAELDCGVRHGPSPKFWAVANYHHFLPSERVQEIRLRTYHDHIWAWSSSGAHVSHMRLPVALKRSPH